VSETIPDSALRNPWPRRERAEHTDVLRFFHPVLPSHALRDRPVRVTVAERNYVLFRGPDGRAAALDDECPHRRAPLSRGSVRPDGRLACGYHGWHFDAAGHGISPSCPELRHCDVPAYQVIERHDYLWLANSDVPVASLPSFGWEGYRFAGTVTTRFDASLEVTLDNISEDEHFAFVHSTFGWDERGAADVDIATDNHPDRSEVRVAGSQRRSIVSLLGGVRAGDRFWNRWVTRFDPVHAVYTFGWEDPRSGTSRPVTTRAVVFLVPERRGVTHANMFLFLKVTGSPQRLVRPVIHWLARRVALTELRRDARFAAYLADAPVTLRGMRLTKFDKALIHNRKLLQRIYWGGAASGDAQRGEESTDVARSSVEGRS
jgi:Phenylpropionate dioxygenase and related ring-hydroxylating dioxygenases, large terminal subunit